MGRILNDKEISTVVESYRLYDGNAAEAARYLSCTSPTIRKYWRKANFPIGKHGGKRVPLPTNVFYQR